MVDAGAQGSAARARRDVKDAHAGVAGIQVDVRPADDMALADYDRFCRDGVHAPAQHPLWVRSWVEATGADVVIATLHRDHGPACALVLEIVQEGPFRIARFVGGRHANGNFVAIADRHEAPLSPAEAQMLVEAIRINRRDVDLLLLQRQNPVHDGIPNAFTNVQTMRSPNVSLSVDLSGGFEEMLGRRGGKRKRKKLRQQGRKFEEAGGYRLIEAKTREEADRLLDAFFAMKAARFAEKGIPNVFAPRDVQAFFRLLFGGAVELAQPPFLLHSIEVAGTLRAVNGCSVADHSIVCEFGGICEGIANTSPGFILDYHSIEEACSMGKAFYDFSVGDEEYKRSWCDVETWQFDTMLPLTARGRVIWAFEMARAQTVRLVKSNEALWSVLKQLRAKVAGTKPAPAEH